MIAAAFDAGLVVEGLSFHVGSQCTNFDNYVQALQLMAGHLPGGLGPRLPADEDPGHRRRFPRALRRAGQAVPSAGQDAERGVRPAVSRRTWKSWPNRAGFSWPRPGRSWSSVIGKAVRDGKLCYYINDGVYHTFSGVIFDHIQYHLKAFTDGRRADLRRVRSDLRRAGHDLAGRGAAGPGAGRPGLQREHRRLQPRLLDLLQRLPAGQGGAYPSIVSRLGGRILAKPAAPA